MKQKFTALLTDGLPPAPQDDEARPARSADAPALAMLMLEAYRGTTDDEGETIEDAVAEVTRLFDGAYGEFDGEASEVVVRDGAIVCATLVTRYQNEPLIAFSMTAPAWQRHGLARASIGRTMTRLALEGEKHVHVAVTDGNTPAEMLYTGLGFVSQ